MNNYEKISRIRKNHFFAIGDIIVYVLVVVLIGVFTLFAFLQNEKEGTRFELIYQKKVVFTATLEQDAYFVFYIQNGQGKVKEGNDTSGLKDFNLIQVKDKKVSVILSDCPDKVCYTGSVCLPHEFSIKVYYDGLESDI